MPPWLKLALKSLMILLSLVLEHCDCPEHGGSAAKPQPPEDHNGKTSQPAPVA